MKQLAVLVFVALTGCAGMQVKKDQVTAARKVALVGYQGVLQLDDPNQKNNGLAGAIGASKAASDLFSGKLGQRRAEQGLTGYTELSRRLQSTFQWDVVPSTALATVPVYQERLSKSIKVARLGSQTVEGVLTPSELQSFKKQDLGALAQQLGVDAVASVSLTYTVGKTGGFAVAGMGSTTRYPVATAHLTVVDAKGAVIWEDYAARGQVTSQGLRTTMGAELVENETEVLNEAALSAFDALLQRYQAFEEKK